MGFRLASSMSAFANANLLRILGRLCPYRHSALSVVKFSRA
jgi:hypothetical protein